MPEHLLLYEPRTEGHHLGWLRFLTEDLLSANLQLSLAVDLRPAGRGLLEEHLAELLPQVKLLSVFDAQGRSHAHSKLGSVALCLEQSGAGKVFLAAFDEIASDCWRRAALGLTPPETLRRRMGGIYHRPRFLVAPWWSPNRWLKAAGFRRVILGGWLRQLLFVDEYLTSELQQRFPTAPLFFLPDPCPAGFDGDTLAARTQLALPQDKRVALFFGTGYRRKGLHLTVEAMLSLDAKDSPFLFCAGQLNPTGPTAAGLQKLTAQGRARVLERYVTPAEEKLSFAATDMVLLPYVNHFGTSGVLSRAAAAGKMVIASDEQLLGRLTREHQLGLLFPSRDVARLRDCLRRAAGMNEAELQHWSTAAKSYARKYSRAAYRAAILASLQRQ